jgi:hypothetical protein
MATLGTGAATYVRVSTEEQVDGTSLALQRESCRRVVRPVRRRVWWRDAVAENLELTDGYRAWLPRAPLTASSLKAPTSSEPVLAGISLQAAGLDDAP